MRTEGSENLKKSAKSGWFLRDMLTLRATVCKNLFIIAQNQFSFSMNDLVCNCDVCVFKNIQTYRSETVILLYLKLPRAACDQTGFTWCLTVLPEHPRSKRIWAWWFGRSSSACLSQAHKRVEKLRSVAPFLNHFQPWELLIITWQGDAV